MADFKYKIIKKIALLSQRGNSSKEVNIISWNNSAPKFDIRNWDDGKPGKGISLDNDEYDVLTSCIESNTNAKEADRYSLEDFTENLDEYEWLDKDEEGKYKINFYAFELTSKLESQISVSQNDENYTFEYCINIPLNTEDADFLFDFINKTNRKLYEDGLAGNVFFTEEDDDENIIIGGTVTVYKPTDVDEYLSFIFDFLDNNEENLGEIMQYDLFYEARDLGLDTDEDLLNNKHLLNEEVTPEIRNVGITEFIVVGNMKSCIHQNHSCEEVVAVVDFMREDGGIIRIETRAFYCKNCNAYFIRKYDYEKMIQQGWQGKILCQVITVEKYVSNGGFGNRQLNDESILNKLGYNLSGDKSEKQRQEILKRIVEEGVMSKERVASYLSYFISMNGRRAGMENAVACWESDREYILGEKTGKIVKPNVIRYIKYS